MTLQQMQSVFRWISCKLPGYFSSADFVLYLHIDQAVLDLESLQSDMDASGCLPCSKVPIIALRDAQSVFMYPIVHKPTRYIRCIDQLSIDEIGNHIMNVMDFLPPGYKNLKTSVLGRRAASILKDLSDA